MAILVGYFVAEVFTSNPWGLPYLGENPSLRANDLTRLMDASRGFTPIEGVTRVLPGEPVPYPPAAFVYFGLLAKLPVKWAMAAFYIPCLLYVWVAARIAVAASENAGERAVWLIAIIFCYPILYVLDRANLDAYTALGSFAFVCLLLRDQTKLAAILLATAAALKLYPALLTVLLVRRDPKAVLVFLGVFGLETSIALWTLSQTPSTAIDAFIGQLANASFCYNSVTLCLNLSAAVPFKVALASFVTFDWYSSISDVVPTLYGLFSIALALFSVVLVLFRKAPLWQDVLLLTCVMNFVPVMSYDYKLILYLAPLVLMLEDRPLNTAMVATIFLVAIMLSSFKWMSGNLHLWIHAITQIALFVVALLPTNESGEILVSRHATMRRVKAGLACVIAGITGLAIWNVFGPNVIRRVWAHSHSWCPDSFTFTTKDPAPLWGTGWSSFDGKPGGGLASPVRSDCPPDRARGRFRS
jgi:hypothetical protein